ncbi:LANO_0E01728g1_1 [Lachancea nothofagi CBS 11611]|uniref:LANO_0E01728g1_1 n=1 Tax=Lachancea nothofagi CBS 11611 TaxID=1266666 RepID=A0A1G4JPL5_9SACH|nr:LANO_0E01728g1_1 [Lachancea nothofagi CBS 11611]
MSRDAPLKAEKDYTEILQDELPKIEVLAKNNDVEGALEQLLILEKKTRQASDLESSKKLMAQIVELLASRNQWDVLDEQLALLAKKHGQLKLSVQFMIQQIMERLENVADRDTKVRVIEAIRAVTENKIFVEVERARVTRILTQIRRSEGKIDEAADLLCSLQVETFGSMEMSEKIEFILEQMELSILKGDFAQATVLSRKILKKTFKNAKYEALKLEYFHLLIKIGLHKRDYLQVAQYYQELYNTDAIKADEAKWKDALTHVVMFLVLTPYDNLQNDLIHKIQLDNNLKKLEKPESLAKLFTTPELMRWPIVKDTYETFLNADNVAFGSNEAHWEDLRKRVIEHNLRVVSKYYTRINLSRLNELLDLTEPETERFISDLVNQGIIYAKINRPAKIVNFGRPETSSSSLNEWSSNVDQLLEQIETIGHLITKEEILHGLRAN